MNNLPGGELAARPLHFIWVCDCSGSMATGGPYARLGTAGFRVVASPISP